MKLPNVTQDESEIYIEFIEKDKRFAININLDILEESCYYYVSSKGNMVGSILSDAMIDVLKKFYDRE
jgi:hypothetical protein